MKHKKLLTFVRSFFYVMEIESFDLAVLLCLFTAEA